MPELCVLITVSSFISKHYTSYVEVIRNKSPILLQGIGTGSSGSLLNIENKAIYFNSLTRGTPIALINTQSVCF
jgi:hypothetical protein